MKFDELYESIIKEEDEETKTKLYWEVVFPVKLNKNVKDKLVYKPTLLYAIEELTEKDIPTGKYFSEDPNAGVEFVGKTPEDVIKKITKHILDNEHVNSVGKPKIDKNANPYAD